MSHLFSLRALRQRDHLCSVPCPGWSTGRRRRWRRPPTFSTSWCAGPARLPSQGAARERLVLRPPRSPPPRRRQPFPPRPSPSPRTQCYNNKNMLTAGIIVAGWDKVKGGQVFAIPVGGGLLQRPFAIGGERSPAPHPVRHAFPALTPAPAGQARARPTSTAFAMRTTGRA